MECGDMQGFLLIIDGSSLLSTQFYGNLPKEIMFSKTTEEKEAYYHKIMQTSTGIYTNAVYGFLRFLLKLLKDQKPTYLAVTWDLGRNTFRRERYAEYKAQRSETILPLREQFVLCQKVLKQMGIMQFMDDYYEADDFSGTLAKRFENDIAVAILTKDNDYLQLVDEHTTLWMIHGTAKKTEELYHKYHMDADKMRLPERVFPFTPELVKKEFGIKPTSVNSLKGLQGDPSDNIKGVPGVGEKAACALISEYESVDKLYEVIHEAERNGEEGIAALNQFWKTELSMNRSPMVYLRKKDENALVGEQAAKLSTELATIKTDIDLGTLTLEELRINIQYDAAKKAFHELEFKSLQLELPEKVSKKSNTVNYCLIEDLSEAETCFQTICSLSKKQEARMPIAVSFVNEEESLLGLSLMYQNEEVVWMPIGGFLTEDYLTTRVRELTNENLKLIAFSVKDIPVLASSCSEEQCFDVGVATYLLNPLQSDYGYASIAMTYLSESVPVREELPKGIRLSDAGTFFPEHYLPLCTAECRTAFMVYPVILSELKKTKMLGVFDKIEMPLVFTLYEMEREGIMVNAGELERYGQELSVGIGVLEKEICSLAGEEFNINSPKQLGPILFEKLGLPGGKKGKTGYTTSVDVLEKLSTEHPIVEKILEYRQLTKLKSTYVDGLRSYIGSDQRIHCKFQQTITATGRLSCTEPNLQNIPIRYALGREIRKVFIPKEGCVFVDCDYSQIELRILAHMANDEQLLKAYGQDMDIHRITASQVFHTPLAEVTKEQRSNAKAVNFGIVYGISSFGLGQGLNISRKEAETYINRYFETYPGVKVFLDQLVENAISEGYATTLYGRRRPVPELASANVMQKKFGERIAMNSPIQGTAADIMKIAMLRVSERLKKESLKSKLLLQIHDELLVECTIDEVETVKGILYEELHGAANLRVPLEVEITEGANWYEAK